MTKYLPYKQNFFDGVEQLWTEIILELSSSSDQLAFERYVKAAIDDELKAAEEVFARNAGNDLRVVQFENSVIGTFGIQRVTDNITELRRMYLRREYRGTGIAGQMLDKAEQLAKANGFTKIVLSTAEIQKGAIKFYLRSGYEITREEVATEMTAKTVGLNLKRFHFEKSI